MPVLLAVTGHQAGTCFTFDRETIVGRSSECHLRVRDGRTSRRHARFLITEGKTSVEDLGSRNGTFLNGRRIHAKSLLEPSDRAWSESVRKKVVRTRTSLRNTSWFVTALLSSPGRDVFLVQTAAIRKRDPT